MTTRTPTPVVDRARVAVAVVFALDGLAFASEVVVGLRDVPVGAT